MTKTYNFDRDYEEATAFLDNLFDRMRNLEEQVRTAQKKAERMDKEEIEKRAEEIGESIAQQFIRNALDAAGFKFRGKDAIEHAAALIRSKSETARFNEETPGIVVDFLMACGLSLAKASTAHDDDLRVVLNTIASDANRWRAYEKKRDG